jgi:hypothetical protein
LARAEELWQQAGHAVAGDEELSARVRLGHLPVTYVWLANWNTLRQQCQAIGAKWPLDNSPRQAALEWRKIADGVPGKPWTKVTQLNEAGLTPDAFSSRFE